GEHQTFFRHVPDRRAAPQIFDEPHANVNLAHDRDLRSEHAFDRIGKVIVEAGPRFAIEGTESKHDAILIGIDAVEPGEAPDQYGGEQDQHGAFAAQIAA